MPSDNYLHPGDDVIIPARVVKIFEDGRYRNVVVETRTVPTQIALTPQQVQKLIPAKVVALPGAPPLEPPDDSEPLVGTGLDPLADS